MIEKKLLDWVKKESGHHIVLCTYEIKDKIEELAKEELKEMEKFFRTTEKEFAYFDWFKKKKEELEKILNDEE